MLSLRDHSTGYSSHKAATTIRPRQQDAEGAERTPLRLPPAQMLQGILQRRHLRYLHKPEHSPALVVGAPSSEEPLLHLPVLFWHDRMASVTLLDGVDLRGAAPHCLEQTRQLLRKRAEVQACLDLVGEGILAEHPPMRMPSGLDVRHHIALGDVEGPSRQLLEAAVPQGNAADVRRVSRERSGQEPAEMRATMRRHTKAETS